MTIHENKDRIKAIKKFYKRQFEAFCKICVATRKYYWLYTPTPFLQKYKDSPTYLGDSLIKKHILGKEENGHVVVLGLSPFIDNEHVLNGGIDFDIHGPSQKQKELKLKEFGGDEKKYKEYEDGLLETQRKQVKDDISKITEELDRLGYLYFLNSSGSEGVHLRVYSSMPVNAKIMRYFLKNLQEQILGEERHEIFPKQNILDEDTPFGNQLKAVLAVHPKYKKLAGIIHEDKILNREESLNFLVEFAKKMPRARPIKFEITSEIEKKYEKKKLSVEELEKINAEGIPYYCAGFEEVACKQFLQSGRTTRHDYLDGNAYQYLNDKPQLFNDYCEIQGRNRTAFNKSENWRWSCLTIHKYLRTNEGEGIELWKEKCQKCPHFAKAYLPDLKPLLECGHDLEKRDKIIRDILKSKKNADPLNVNTLLEQIELITGIKITALKKQFNHEQEKQEKEKKFEGLKIGKAITKFTDFLDMAEQFIKVQPVYYDKNKILWCWNFKDNRWEIIDETDLMNLIDKNVAVFGTIDSKIKQMILESLKRKARLNKPTEVKDTWVQFKDKIIDIKTGEEFKASPKFFATNPIPWEVGENEDTPTMDRIFREWVGEKYVPTLYEIIAFSLSPIYFIHRISCLIGSGSNGKTKFLLLLKKFVGDKNSTSTELELLLPPSRFESAKLYKKLICIMGETNFNIIKKTSFIKKLTGEDLFGFEFKHKDPFDDLNYAKILIATNNLPVTCDKTKGYYRRWFIIEFPNEFSEKKDILAEIPEIEYNNLARKSIRILKELWIKREFSNEGTIEEREKKYEEKSNPLNLFIKERCVKDVNEDIPFFEFYEDYNAFLCERKYRIQTSNEVGRLLSKEGYDRKNKNIVNNKGYNTTQKYIMGLNWKGKNTDNTNNIPNPTLLSYRDKREGNSIISNIGNISTNEGNVTLPEEEWVFDPSSQKDLLAYIKANLRDNAVFVDENFDKELVAKLLKESVIFESPKGTYKVL